MKEFENFLKKINVQQNSNICLTTNILNLIKFDRNKSIEELGNNLIDILIDYIGDYGTIVIPAFNWDFCNKKIFDKKFSISQVGSFANIALKREDFKRTHHAIYSFLVYGKLTEELISNNSFDAFSNDSLINLLYLKKFKQVFINTNLQDGFFFVHLAEQKVGVDYRFIKTFSGTYIDEKGTKKKQKFSMYVRKDKSKKWFIPYTGKKVNTGICESFIKKLIAKRAYKSFKNNLVNMQSVDIYEAVSLLENSIITNECLVYPKYK